MQPINWRLATDGRTAEIVIPAGTVLDDPKQAWCPVCCVSSALEGTVAINFPVTGPTLVRVTACTECTWENIEGPDSA